MPSNTLVCPLLNDDPMSAYGVEFGRLCSRMRDSDGPVAEFFTRSNQDQILLLACRLGWSVREVKPWDKFWLRCHLEEMPAPVG